MRPAALVHPDTIGRFLLEYARLPDGFSVVTSSVGDNLSIGLVDGAGLGCRYARFTVSRVALESRDTAAALDLVTRRAQSAMLAMCEYPERYCPGEVSKG